MRSREAHMAELIAALRAAAERSAQTRAVVLAGNGPAFCAGHDLREMIGRDIATYRRLFDRCVELMTDDPGDPAAGDRASARHRDRRRLPARRHLRSRPRQRRRPLCHPGREHRALLHHADGGADARHRPQARHGDADDRRGDRCARPRPNGDWSTASFPPPSSTRRRARWPTPSPPPAPLSSRSASRPSTRRSISISRKAYAYAKEVMSMNALAADAQEGMCAFVEKRKPRWSGR